MHAIAGPVSMSPAFNFHWTHKCSRKLRNLLAHMPTHVDSKLEMRSATKHALIHDRCCAKVRYLHQAMLAECSRAQQSTSSALSPQVPRHAQLGGRAACRGCKTGAQTREVIGGCQVHMEILFSKQCKGSLICTGEYCQTPHRSVFSSTRLGSLMQSEHRASCYRKLAGPP